MDRTITIRPGTLVDNLTLSIAERWAGDLPTTISVVVDDYGACQFALHDHHYRVHITLVEQHDHANHRLTFPQGLPAVPERVQDPPMDKWKHLHWVSADNLEIVDPEQYYMTEELASIIGVRRAKSVVAQRNWKAITYVYTPGWRTV